MFEWTHESANIILGKARLRPIDVLSTAQDGVPWQKQNSHAMKKIRYLMTLSSQTFNL